MAGGDDEYEAMEEAEFNSFLRTLIEAGEIKDGPAEGIAKFVLQNGRAKLSPKQAFVFERDIIKPYTFSCDQCGEQIPWSEAYDFSHSRGRCAYCQGKYEKFMEEK